MEKPLHNFKTLTALLLLCVFFSGKSNAQVSTLQNWDLQYNSNSSSTQNVSFPVSTGTDSNRLLVVAIASSQTNTGARTVAITYGGQALTLANGNMATTGIRQHTAFYYLKEAGLDAASSATLSFTVSGGTTRVTTVWAAVFDYVDQTTSITNSQNYSTATAADPYSFGTNLTINANDQAVHLVSTVRNNNTNERAISSYPANFTMVDEQTWTTTDGVRNGIANRSVPTSNTSSDGATNLSGTALGSMTGISIKGCTAPIVNAGSALAAICKGGTSAALGGSIGGSATGATWSDGGVGGTFNPNATTLNATWTPPGAYSGTATLTLTTSGGSCGTASASKNIVVNPAPTSVTANASSSSICLGSSIGLTSSATSNSNPATVFTILSENFNATPVGWTTVANTGTGGTPAASNWTLRANGYATSSETLNSNDASQFYLSDSDASGNGSTTVTILQSPAFSTAGMSSASFNFYHYYRYNNGTDDRGFVEVSTNGTTWSSPVLTYSSNQGTRNGFVLATLNLSAYLNQATVYVRFRYTASWDWYWAIDNVTVTGTYTTPPASFAWTSTPSGYTSSVQNPTGISPNATTTYTVTATNSYGCTTSASTSAVAVNDVPTIAAITAPSALCASGSLNPTAPTVTANGSTVTSQGWQLETAVGSGTFANLTVPYSVVFADNGKKIRYTATNGCGTTNSNQVTLTINNTPTVASISAPAALCASGSLNPSAPSVTANGSTVSSQGWQISTTVGGGTYTTLTLPYTVAFADNGKNIRYTATNGCGSTTSNVVAITVNNTPTVGSISAPAALCTGSSLNPAAPSVTANGSTVSSQGWQISTTVGGGTYTTLTLPYTVAFADNGKNIRYTATNGCGTTTSNVVAITVNARPTASVISGTATVCAGSTTNIQVAITGGTSPFSVVYSGGSVGSYTSGSNIPVTQASTTTYTLTSVTDANGCVGVGNSGSAVLTVNSTTSTNGGPWSNGTPTASKSAIFDNTNVTLGADFTACSLTLKNNSIVSVASGTDVTLVGALAVEAGSAFTLNNNANLLQSIPAGTSYTNSGNIVVKRNSSAIKRLDYTLWSSPVSGQGVYSFTPSTFGNRFYVYRTTTNVYNNADLGFNITGLDPNGVNGTDSNNVQFANAKGYLIRMPWDHPTAATVWNGTFTGVPHNGDITFTMTNGGAGQRFNLVGNPYPSPISMTQFVSDNSAKITGTLYFWRETNNNTSNNAYCSWAGGTFVSNSEAQVFNPNAIIRTGQGFFVEASGASTTVDFKNSQRSSDNSNHFFKNNNVVNDVETNRFWLNLTNTSGAFCQMAAGYMSDATNGVDMYDGKNINTGAVLLSSILDDTDYTIQGKALPFNASDIIPLSMKITTAGSYSIAIDHVDGIFTGGAQEIYLKDNQTSTIHNLSTGAYNFASDAGTFTSRFEVVYQTQLGNPTFTANSVVIYTQNNDFVVNSGNAIMKSIKVFDIRGRLLQEKTGINASHAIINGGEANQVLLVQITSEDGVVAKKKVIR